MTAFSALFFLLPSLTMVAQPVESKKALHLMGSRFELVAVHEHKTIGLQAIDSAIKEIRRIETLISSWDVHSETSEINANAGIKPTNVSKELFDLIERSIKVSNLTGGAFDISFSSIDPFWTFDGRTVEAPDSAEIAASVHKINYRNIILDHESLTVFLKEKGMKIGFGAIGKGYAANKAKQLMTNLGIENGMVNAGGDLMAWGNQSNGKPWQIGIADPAKERDFVGWLAVKNLSVVTSGNYEKYVIIDDVRYGHIIDPKTGWPAKGIKSVTIVSPDAELSDALATSVFVLGMEEGLKLVNRLKNVECLIIDDNNKILTSEKLNLNYY